MISRFLTSRNIFLGIILFCGGLLGFALVLQYFVDLIPCPLCIVQRFFYFLIGMVALSGYYGWFRKVSVRVYGWKIVLLSLLGGAVALRQVWLQHFSGPVDPTRCGVLLGSFVESVILSLGGKGSCAVIDWTFLGLSIADWSLLCFGFLLIVGLYLVWKHTDKESAIVL
ncbi:MAG: disulfide bond formation protein B [Patescibacteria group bacterium]